MRVSSTALTADTQKTITQTLRLETAKIKTFFAQQRQLSCHNAIFFPDGVQAHLVAICR